MIIITDMVLVVIEGSNRDMGTTYTLLNDVIVPNIHAERILVTINRADVAMKGRHWDSLTNKPVYYSAEHNWNVKAVFVLIVENMPSHRRELMK